MVIQNEIVIKLKKTKIFGNIIVSLIIFFISLYIYLYPELLISKLISSAHFLKIIGLLGSIMFLVIIISYIIKLFENKVGLIITNEFIIDKSVYESVGKIYWDSIIKIEPEEEYVHLHITKKFEEDYIQRLNLFKKIIIFIKKGTYKSKIMINSINLDCSSEELVLFLNKGFLAYKESSKHSLNNSPD